MINQSLKMQQCYYDKKYPCHDERNVEKIRYEKLVAGNAAALLRQKVP